MRRLRFFLAQLITAALLVQSAVAGVVVARMDGPSAFANAHCVVADPSKPSDGGSSGSSSNGAHDCRACLNCNLASFAANSSEPALFAPSRESRSVDVLLPIAQLRARDEVHSHRARAPPA